MAPKTGIEQPFLLPGYGINFMRTRRDIEPICDSSTLKAMLIEEYKQKDLLKSPSINKVVYDSLDTQSPYYPQGEYLKKED